MWFVDCSYIDEAHMSPAPNGSSAIWWRNMQQNRLLSPPLPPSLQVWTKTSQSSIEREYTTSTSYLATSPLQMKCNPKHSNEKWSGRNFCVYMVLFRVLCGRQNLTLKLLAASLYAELAPAILKWGSQCRSVTFSEGARSMTARGVWGHAPQENFEF